MSKATKRKHVTNEVVNDYVLPDEDKQIVRVVSSRGNNLHEVVTSSGDAFLASMPTKFRKNVWIKRGDYVMVFHIAEGEKVKAEITHILLKPQIQYIQSQGLWPPQFDSGLKSDSDKGSIPHDMLPPSDSEESGSEDDDAGDDTNFEKPSNCYNPNRPQFSDRKNNDDDDDDEDSDEDDDDDNDEPCQA